MTKDHGCHVLTMVQVWRPPSRNGSSQMRQSVRTPRRQQSDTPSLPAWAKKERAEGSRSQRQSLGGPERQGGLHCVSMPEHMTCFSAWLQCTCDFTSRTASLQSQCRFLSSLKHFHGYGGAYRGLQIHLQQLQTVSMTMMQDASAVHIDRAHNSTYYM